MTPENNNPSQESTPPLGVSSIDLLATIVEKEKAEGAEHLYCHHFKQIEGCPHCCESCHIDHDDYGYSMCGTELFGMHVECCCCVADWLEDEAKKAANAKDQ